ncbi:hypothetical protein G7Y89_g6951 [Cudoniella acicularis]|uniref:Uncharacterized protein n=1 Tax=Cudoniella acicularis TaxID=354080 RepID=A0A8H4RMY3_9HELO|nr:hypothetical protein G7Y89_g6951 [Cudoniella acicularis]
MPRPTVRERRREEEISAKSVQPMGPMETRYTNAKAMMHTHCVYTGAVQFPGTMSRMPMRKSRAEPRTYNTDETKNRYANRKGERRRCRETSQFEEVGAVSDDEDDACELCDSEDAYCYFGAAEIGATEAVEGVFGGREPQTNEGLDCLGAFLGACEEPGRLGAEREADEEADWENKLKGEGNLVCQVGVECAGAFDY